MMDDAKALSLYRLAHPWLVKKQFETCACGSCHLCAYLYIAARLKKLEEMEKDENEDLPSG